MVLLGPWTNGRGLLCLIAKFEIRDYRPHPPNHKAPRLGPRAFSTGVVEIHWGRGLFEVRPSLFTNSNFKLNRAAALAEWRQLLSA